MLGPPPPPFTLFQCGRNGMFPVSLPERPLKLGLLPAGLHGQGALSALDLLTAGRPQLLLLLSSLRSPLLLFSPPFSLCGLLIPPSTKLILPKTENSSVLVVFALGSSILLLSV